MKRSRVHIPTHKEKVQKILNECSDSDDNEEMMPPEEYEKMLSEILASVDLDSEDDSPNPDSRRRKLDRENFFADKPKEEKKGGDTTIKSFPTPGKV